MTLVELLITISLLIIVVGAILAFLETSGRIVPKDRERQLSIREGQVGLYRMVRELRQGHDTDVAGFGLPTAATNQIDVVVNGKWIRYDCAIPGPAGASPPYTECWRYASADATTQPSTSSGTRVIDHVLNTATNPVFTPNSASTPTAYGVSIEIPQKDPNKGTGYQSTVTLRDRFYMRNALGALQ
jgi:type II secretory pathway pseudopilin PulG